MPPTSTRQKALKILYLVQSETVRRSCARRRRRQFELLEPANKNILKLYEITNSFLRFGLSREGLGIAQENR